MAGAYLRGPEATRGKRRFRLRRALLFSTRVIGPPEAELALVTLGRGAIPARELEEIVGLAGASPVTK